MSDNRVSTLETNLTDISNNRLDAVETSINTLSISDISGLTDALESSGGTTINADTDITVGTISSLDITARSGTITAPSITATSSLIVDSKNVVTELSKKQDTIDIYDNFIINSMYVTPNSTKTLVNSTVNGELRASILKVEDDTLGLIDVAGSINSLTTAVDEKQEEIKTTSNISLNTLDATGQITCGDLTVGGSTIQTLVDNASGSGLTKSDIDGKQNILTAGKNISIVTTTETTTNITTNTISATGNVTQTELAKTQDNISATSLITLATLNVMSSLGVSTILDVPGEITCDSLLVGGTDINTLIDNKLGSSTPTSTAVNFKARGGGKITIYSGEILVYDTILFNEGGEYSDSTYKFAAPVTGLYHFIMSFYGFDTLATEVDILQYDGAEKLIERIRNTGFKKKIGSLITFCNTGDEIYSRCTFNSLQIYDGTKDGSGDPLCNFSGFLITETSSGAYGCYRRIFYTQVVACM